MNDLSKKFIVYGAILMALAVILGAFGAHGLKSILSCTWVVCSRFCSKFS